MRVCVELNSQDENRLLHWASVGRTLSAIEGLLEIAYVGTEKEDELIYIIDELRLLHPALENLHLAYRAALNKGIIS